MYSMKNSFFLNGVKTVRLLFFLTAFMVTGLSPVLAQEQVVTGVVKDSETSEPIPGVNVLIKGTTKGTVTDVNGAYRLTVTPSDVLVFSSIGYTSQEVPVGTQSNVDISFAADVTALQEVVVTGYTEQRTRDITGAVSVVKADELKQVASANVGTQLAGRAAGVTVSTSSEPGGASNIRIRGFSSLGMSGSDPLIIIDGVQTQGDKSLSGLNPNDIESMQVLKDASAASIYGARANNGVIIITTKKGTAGKIKVNYDGYVGVQTPVGGYDDFLILDPMEYAQVVYREQENVAGFNGDYGAISSLRLYGGGPTPVLPNYIFPVRNDGRPYATEAEIIAANGPYNRPNNMIFPANQSGTNWWDEVFDPASMTSHNLSVSGGTEAAVFNVSAGWLKQNGTMIHTGFERYSLRANSQFNAGRFTFGESLSFARSTNVNQPGGNQQEGNAMTQIIKTQPIIPVRDIAGNPANGKSSGLSNGSNPVVLLENNQHNESILYSTLANFFTSVKLTDFLSAKSSFSFDYRNQFNQNFQLPNFENSEPGITSPQYFEQNQNTFNWTWTNTLHFDKTFGKHNLKLLAGYEAFKATFRNIQGNLTGYATTEIDARYLNTGLGNIDSRQVQSNGNINTIASTFGQLNYEFNDKYLVSVTARRDGSSNFASSKRYGVFPAVSLGWRISSEPFMQQLTWLDDLKLRAGWGITGNQFIDDTGNAFDRYSGGADRSFYAITGSNSALARGYTLQNRGNPTSGWEENESLNAGIDFVLLNGKLSGVLDVYTRTVKGLLYRALLPGTAGGATPAAQNVGEMKNNGWDLGLNYRDKISGDLGFNVGVNFSHYKNEITKIVGDAEFFFPSGVDSRFGTTNINKIGNPISSFYGYTMDGIFRDAGEVAAHATQDGAAPGRIRFKDINNDGVINDGDRGVIGTPHPDLTMGLNLGANYKNFDLSVFLFGSFGNQIFNYNRIFTDFRLFQTNVRRAVLTDSWTPENPNASIPRLDAGDTYSRQPSDYYVENGSFLRARTIQIGYTLPAIKAIGFTNVRLYLQGQNLFTITKYSGIDPDVTNVNVGQTVNGQRQNDQWTGFDFGNYPASRIYMVGLNATF